MFKNETKKKGVIEKLQYVYVNITLKNMNLKSFKIFYAPFQFIAEKIKE